MTDALGNRMKEYENVSRIYLPRRMPVIIRVDGRAFHTLTRGFDRPFDEVLHEVMCVTANMLCQGIEGVKFAYTQSDEISLLLTNDDSIDTLPWFGNNLQKLVSLSASIATLAFNRTMHEAVIGEGNQNDYEVKDCYRNALDKAMFDARAFVLPPSEVVNYFIWRQQDATRNSIQMAAQALYPHKELQNKNCDQLQEMIFQKGINWNDYEPWMKRGTALIKRAFEMTAPDGSKTIRNYWVSDDETPIFTENRSYIESRFIKEC